jgi:hypothetical protein
VGVPPREQGVSEWLPGCAVGEGAEEVSEMGCIVSREGLVAG